MIWDKQEQDLELFEFVQKLISLRKKIPALGNKGEFHIIESNTETNHIIYEKRSKNESIFIAINNSEQPIQIRFLFWQKMMK